MGSAAGLDRPHVDDTPRKSGESLQCIIAKLNSVLQGWFGYFRHCHPSVFRPIDEHRSDELLTAVNNLHRLLCNSSGIGR